MPQASILQSPEEPLNGAPRQIAVQPSAMAEDGSGRAASVAVSGGNKAKLKKGVALLKDLRITAEQPGTYIVCITSASRKARWGLKPP